MLQFSTEFPLKSGFSRSTFLALVVAWLRGMERSDVLSEKHIAELDSENVHLRSVSDEELRLRELRHDGEWIATGFRHDIPDNDGRLWRTEAVLKCGSNDSAQPMLRLRTQCIARSPNAQLGHPRKPYLVKLILQDRGGGEDGFLTVADRPIWLTESEECLEIARAATLGEASNWLPIVYVSATAEHTWQLGETELKRLSYDLGGICHVMVEPSRSFSFRLRERTEGRNTYGGSIALVLPHQGIVRRYQIGWTAGDVKELVAQLKTTAERIKGHLPNHGWDWTELQEQALSFQRKRDRNTLSAAEMERLYDEEIEALKDENQLLRKQLSEIHSAELQERDSENLTPNLVRILGPEIYSGEICDRLLFAAKALLPQSDKIGLDSRTKAMLERFVQRFPVSQALAELKEDLNRATKEPSRVSRALTSLLVRHGYREKSENKHIRLEAKAEFSGLDSITVPKTPSDYRGLKNLCKQIESALGINRLDT